MKLIDADKTKVYTYEPDKQVFVDVITRFISLQPTVDAIPIELYEQVKGERDVAIEQLKALNIELFEKPYLKAIPIEWIEEYIKSLVIKRRLLAEDGYRDNRCYDYMFGIIGMLDDWDKEIREKENDKMS